MTNTQAEKLNDLIQKESSTVFDLLSVTGKNFYFPSLGILSQSIEAQKTDINATIGIAKEDSGSPMFLDVFQENIQLEPKSIYPYAPSPGVKSLRSLWKEMQISKNPSLKNTSYSNPIVTNALTHGLSVAGTLFCDPKDEIILPDLYWENYDLSFGLICQAQLKTYPLFNDQNRFNIEGLKQQLQGKNRKKMIILNFPNNPTGYTPTRIEIEQITQCIKNAAEQNNQIVVLIDDAYFGLVFETEVAKESIFTQLYNLSENVLAVKIDGPTKEEYAWGFRVGFMSFGIKNGSNELYQALEQKTAGIIRASISNVSHISQSLLIKGWNHSQYKVQKQQKFDLINTRYQKIKSILETHSEYQKEFIALPFNSGYFMCVQILNHSAEEIRQKLIKKHSVGVIALGNLIRIAFSSTPTHLLEDLFEHLYQACSS